MPMPANTPDKLRATWSDRYVVSDRGCHEWTGARSARGYGAIKRQGRPWQAHRVAYELFVGPIPDGQMVRHRCDNRCCVNPAHLELGTAAENSQDMMDRGRWRGGRPPALPGPDWPIFLKRLNELGLSQTRLGVKFGVSRRAIRNAINRAHRKDSQVS